MLCAEDDAIEIHNRLRLSGTRFFLVESFVLATASIAAELQPIPPVPGGIMKRLIHKTRSESVEPELVTMIDYGKLRSWPDAYGYWCNGNRG